MAFTDYLWASWQHTPYPGAVKIQICEHQQKSGISLSKLEENNQTLHCVPLQTLKSFDAYLIFFLYNRERIDRMDPSSWDFI